MSNKRSSSEMTDYDMGDGPASKKFKSSNVQIVATNEEIDHRIAMLVESKKQSTGNAQFSEHLQADMARIAASESSSSSRKQQRTETGQTGETTAGIDSATSPNEHVVTLTDRLPPGLPDIVEDRLRALERKVYSNISIRSVPRDVYGRLKTLEEKVLALEKKGILSHKPVETQQTGSAPHSAATTATIPEEVDDRIRELQQKLLSQQHGNP